MNYMPVTQSGEKQTKLKRLSRTDIENMDVARIKEVLATGTLDGLTPQERTYYDAMDRVRGLTAALSVQVGGQERISTKAGIIRLLQTVYGFTAYMARMVYQDALNFFYSDADLQGKAWANVYAERLDNWAKLAAVNGDMKTALAMTKEAASLRGCDKDNEVEIPDELLNAAAKRTVIYTTRATDLGLPEKDDKLEEYIDSLPEVSVITKERLKEDAGIRKMDLINRMTVDKSEFGDDSKEEDRG